MSHLPPLDFEKFVYVETSDAHIDPTGLPEGLPEMMVLPPLKTEEYLLWDAHWDDLRPAPNFGPDMTIHNQSLQLKSCQIPTAANEPVLPYLGDEEEYVFLETSSGDITMSHQGIGDWAVLSPMEPRDNLLSDVSDHHIWTMPDPTLETDPTPETAQYKYNIPLGIYLTPGEGVIATEAEVVPRVRSKSQPLTRRLRNLLNVVFKALKYSIKKTAIYPLHWFIMQALRSLFSAPGVGVSAARYITGYAAVAGTAPFFSALQNIPFLASSLLRTVLTSTTALSLNPGNLFRALLSVAQQLPSLLTPLMRAPTMLVSPQQIAASLPGSFNLLQFVANAPAVILSGFSGIPAPIFCVVLGLFLARNQIRDPGRIKDMLSRLRLMLAEKNEDFKFRLEEYRMPSLVANTF